MSSSRFLVHLLAYAPQRIVERMETLAQLSQGKGWGAADVSAEVAACLNLLPNTLAGESILVVDIGANIGEWSAELVKREPRARVIAIEPTPLASRALARRFLHVDRVDVLQAAVGSVNGEATLVGDLSQTAHVTAVSTVFSTSPRAATRMVRLDSLRELRNAKSIDILKIDTEGGEWDVLEGTGDLLAKTRVIEFEFGEGALDRKRTFRDFWNYFTSRNFVLWRQTPRGLALVDRYEPRLETYACTNYFAVNAKTTVSRSKSIR